MKTEMNRKQSSSMQSTKWQFSPNVSYRISILCNFTIQILALVVNWIIRGYLNQATGDMIPVSGGVANFVMLVYAKVI